MSEIIKVTSADIANGERGSSCNCPIALAVKRSYPGKHVAVTASEITVGGQSVRNQPDQSAFVTDFDKCRAVEPQNFVLDI